MPLDERYFHGLLRDIASTTGVAAITPTGLQAEHFMSADRHQHQADCLVEVVSVLELPMEVLRQLREQSFRPESLLDFWLSTDQTGALDQVDPLLSPMWALLDQYAQELRGWILTSAIGFEQAVARNGGEEGLMKVPQPNGDNPAVLISATTMRQLVL